MSDTVRSIGLFHLAEERRRLQKHGDEEAGSGRNVYVQAFLG